MKKIILLNFILAICFSFSCFSNVITITANGFMFSPDSVVINVGDSIVFATSINHPVVEVDQSTWSVNGSTPKSGGFSFINGAGSLDNLSSGIYYYVCKNHFASGMKGRIFVNMPSGIKNIPSVTNSVQIYPNPTIQGKVRIDYFVNENNFVKIELYDVLGKKISDLISENKSSGKHSIQFDVSNLAKPGLYFVKTTIGNKQSVQKLIISTYQ